MNKRKSIIAGIILLLISGAVCADVLKQKITWAPETLSLPSLKPGQSTTTSAVFTNSSLLSNQKIQGKHLAFQITNGTGTVIKATANFPKQILPGQKVPVTLTISVASSTSAVPPRVISGKVQLVSNGEDGVKIFEKPLLVNIAVSSIPLPPFPNTVENNSTLLGIDSDANGVRDDIDWYVVTTYPDSAKVREALKQNARAYTPFLRDADDKAKTRANNLEWGKADDCAAHVFNNNLETRDRAVSTLLALFLNTKERSRVYNRANGQLGGFSSDSGLSSQRFERRRAACAFDVDSLPN